MTGSRYEYVKNFELPDPILPGTFMVLRIDGRAFHRLSSEHEFVKPNDERALELMDHAARDVMNEFKDIVLAFGESDEYSFLFRKSTSLYNRRHSKILTTVTSLFTSSYVYNWSRYLPNIALKYPPTFDGRIVVYPSPKEVRDYFAWRQADTHINNLYNAVFWALVQQGGETTANAHSILRGTVSSQKHEILHSRFGINYNSISARFRKGSVFVRERVPAEVVHPEKPSGSDAAQNDRNSHALEDTSQGPAKDPPKEPVDRATSEGILLPQKGKKVKLRFTVLLYHCDIIGDAFWDQRPNILQE